jgi:hypothetical protein
MPFQRISTGFWDDMAVIWLRGLVLLCRQIADR